VVKFATELMSKLSVSQHFAPLSKAALQGSTVNFLQLQRLASLDKKANKTIKPFLQDCCYRRRHMDTTQNHLCPQMLLLAPTSTKWRPKSCNC